MNKRKTALMALSLCMVAILAVGGSLAYFYDADSRTNVFTVGNVTIDLYEDFDETDPDGEPNDNIAELHPVTYDPETKERRDDNVIEKEVYVENTGSEDAYVRVHIAIPTILDDGDPSFDASANVLHFNYDKETLGADKWDWSKSTGAPYQGDWNYYETTITETINGEEVEIDYNVYVVTYGTALKKGEVTVDAMSQVYLDKSVTNADITRIKETLGENWKIHVIAEGCQAKGFIDAYEALNTSFGEPVTGSDYVEGIDWEADTIGTQDKDEDQEEPTTVAP